LNHSVASESHVFDFELATVPKSHRVERLEECALGFDGSFNDDGTWLVAQSLRSGIQWPIGAWVRPGGAGPDWVVPREDVSQCVEEAMRGRGPNAINVVALFADMHYWGEELSRWEGKYNRRSKPRVIKFDTRGAKAVDALVRYRGALRSGEVKLVADTAFIAQYSNARRDYRGGVDSDGEKRFFIKKVSHDRKVDACVAGMLANAAASFAVGRGAMRFAGSKPGRGVVYSG
jgi:hypothetical protein